MRKNLLEKLFSWISIASLLVQVLLPLTQASQVYAQETTPTVTDAPTDTPVVTPTDAPSPVDTITPTVSPDNTGVPTVAPTDTVTPSDTNTPAPTDTNTPAPDNTNSSSNPSDNTSTNNSQAPPSPTVAPAPDANGILKATLLQSNDISTPDPAIDFSTGQTSSATLTTDKSDYHPTDTALITGKDFTPNATYSLTISSTDKPATSTTVNVTTDNNGGFLYSYQLDGNYRPNYTVVTKNNAGDTVATTTFTDSNAQQTINSVCLQDQPKSPSGLNCTANDNSLHQVNSVTVIGHGCRFPGDTVTFTADWQLSSNASTRYNLGLYFASAGQASALNGSCSVSTLPSSPAPFTEVGGDQCGDINSGSSGTVSVTMTAVCNPDPLNNGQLKLPYCTAWNQSEAACTGPTDAVPGTKSKCSCNDGFTIPITVSPAIEVLKVLNPSNDPGLFNLQVNGVTASTSANVGNGGDTGKITVASGSATFGETAGTNSSLTDYTKTASCVLRGTQTAVTTTGSGPTWTIPSVTNGQDIVCTITNTRSTGTIELKKIWSGAGGQTTLNIGTSAGGTQTATQQTGAAGAAPLTTGTKTVNPGTYYVSESGGLSNYTSALACSDNGNSVTPGASNSLSVTAGHTVICTFTNTLQQAHLTLVKTLTKDNGGTASTSDWTLTGTGNTNISGATGTANVTNAGVLPGTYTLGETGGPSGYAAGTYSCVKNGGGAVVSNSITLANGDSATCTVNNNDIAPSLTLVKQVIGGSASASTWTLTATGALGSPTNLSGTTPVVSGSNFKADTYTLAESGGPTGYTASNWVCTNGVTATNSQITLGLNQTTTCTITNTRDQGAIELKKVWSGTAGQTTLNIGTTAGASDSASQLTGASGAAPLTTGVKTVNTGTYFVSETGGLTNYNSGLSCTDNGNAVAPGANNSVNVAKGHTVVCTFTNTRNTGTITVKKTLSPSFDQGTFNLQVDGTTKATGGDGTTTNAVTVDTGNHSIAETSANSTVLANYTSTYSCVDNATQASVASGSGTSVSGIAVANNQNVVCTFTNTRKTADLKVIKIVDDGTPLTDWAFSLDGANAVSADANGNVDFGQVTTNVNHTITEGGANQGEYTLVSVTGTNCTNNNDGTSGKANIPNGTSSVTCTFTNNRQTGTIQVKKIVSPSDNGATSWDFAINGQGPSNTTDNTVLGLHDGGSSSIFTSYTGSYEVTESGTSLNDYTTTTSCTDGTNTVTNLGATTGLFTVLTGKHVVCTFTNTIKPGNIHILKYDDLNANGAKESSAEAALQGWKIQVSTLGEQTTDSSGYVTYSNVQPGTYYVSETIQPGWHQSDIACANDIGLDNSNNHQITVAAGQDVWCSIGNYHDAHVIVTKDVLDPDGKPVVDTSTQFGFSIGSDSANLTDGDSHDFTVAPGVFGVTESGSNNYTFGTCTSTDDPNQGALTSSNGYSSTLTSGQTIHVTCTNLQKKGSIIVHKVVLHSDGTTADDNHSFTSEVNGAQDQSFSQNSPYTYTVNPGSPYTVTELSDSNYTNQGCKISADFSANGFSVASGQTVNVTCSNKQNPGTISGYKYKADGVTGILGWSVNLYSCVSAGTNCNTLVGNTLTDATGFYSFTDLVTGFYQVQEVLNSAYTAVSDTFHNVTINPGTESTDNSFKNFKNIDLTVCKVQDADGNLDTTNDQTKVFGWSIQLLVDGQATGDAQKTSESNGCTKFTNLGPDHDYSVTEETKNDWTALGDTTYDFGKPQDGVNQTHTFVNFKNVSISGHKFNDIDGDKTKEENEPYLAGWVFDLYKWNGTSFDFVESSSPTDANGNYSFSNLGPGTYRVREEGQTGWVQTTNNPADITVSSSQNVQNVDFGNQGQGTVIVTKFLDDNADGVMGASESALPDWTMNLDNSSQPTGNEGTTTFDSVLAGTHTLGETQQKGWNLSNIYCDNQAVVIGDVTEGFGHGLVDTSNEHTVNVTPGATVKCYVGNYQNGHIVVKKIVEDPDGNVVSNDPTKFDFAVDGQSDFTLKGGDSQTFDNIKPGDYNVTETGNENYTFGGCNAVYEGDEVGIPVNQQNTQGEKVTVDSGDSVTVTCINKQKLSHITVNKVTDPQGDETSFDTNITGSGTVEGSSSASISTVESHTYDVTAGTYSVNETVPDGWTQTDTTCDEVSVGVNESATCTITNTKKGTVIVTKYFDANKNGVQDEGEQALPGWEILLDGNKKTTGQDGTTTFDNVTPGVYGLSETMQDGWTQTGITCDSQPVFDEVPLTNFEDVQLDTQGHPVFVGAGQTINCSIGNYTKPVLTVTKTNDKLGIDQHPGDSVLYTITITASDAAAENVTLTDLLPKGFKYRDGSATIDTGDGSGPQTFNNFVHVYASPGIWSIGNMDEGQTVTVTLIADIDGGQHAGDYKDVAYAQGESLASETVFADSAPTSNPVDNGVVDDTFVGTHVNVVNDQTSGADVKVVQDVLGASTSSLPSTGANVDWSFAAALMVLFGAGLFVSGIMLKKKYV